MTISMKKKLNVFSVENADVMTQKPDASTQK